MYKRDNRGFVISLWEKAQEKGVDINDFYLNKFAVALNENKVSHKAVENYMENLVHLHNSRGLSWTKLDKKTEKGTVEILTDKKGTMQACIVEKGNIKGKAIYLAVQFKGAGKRHFPNYITRDIESLKQRVCDIEIKRTIKQISNNIKKSISNTVEKSIAETIEI